MPTINLDPGAALPASVPAGDRGATAAIRLLAAVRLVAYLDDLRADLAGNAPPA